MDAKSKRLKAKFNYLMIKYVYLYIIKYKNIYNINYIKLNCIILIAHFLHN